MVRPVTAPAAKANGFSRPALERLADLLPQFAARAAEHDASDGFVEQNYAVLKAAGLMSLAVPAELGGEGIELAALSGAIRDIGRACASTALAFSMHTHLVASLAWHWCHSRAPVVSLLRRIAQEQLALTTSNGSDWLEGSGVARRTKGGFVVDAVKKFVSGAPASELFATGAIYNDPLAGPTVLHFILPRQTKSATGPPWRAMGMRGSGSGEILIKDVFVSDGMIIARRPRGKWSPFYHVAAMIATPLIYSVYFGIAEAARASALDMARARPRTARILDLAGEMDSELHTARVAIADMLDAATGAPGPANTNRVFMNRTLAARSTIASVEKALELIGGAAYIRGHPVERLFRDVQAARFHPVGKHAQLLMAGQLALGDPIDGPMA